MFDIIKNFFESFKMIKEDKENRKKWEFEIKREIQNPISKFNQFGLSMDENFDNVSCLINIPEQVQIEGPDITRYKTVSTEAKPISAYLALDLNWADYLDDPEIYYVEPEDSTEKAISCTYLVTWHYTPVLSRNNNLFWKQLKAFCIINGVIVVGIVALIILALL